ncbi:hypothetical protein CathTA2_0706 [Caldalkalibacillus thermarum TA2.A1]|uniref:Phage tail family protein n=1 Tax=Caldalkalibacillus thermarum (strain TA2.A1) TaxID=986075 RepID=F5L4J3_CALTT|nr:phage tail domain-containing protein [Caldalkalibacillus thermarum]EGL83739.1 hypothetical protein CathTA2_0706 [Caldalkalibacillus thermarum TA2.A1]QZT33982.1 phage tail family protein [Caldalkalibacillus thermarum TA2.A1]
MWINDKHISEYGLKLEMDHEYPFPKTRDRSIDIPGRHGAYDFGADLGVRQFNLPLAHMPVRSRTEKQEQIRAFLNELLDSTGRPKYFKLKFSYESDKHYMVRYAGSIPIQRAVQLSKFNLPLTAFDPYAYADMNAYDNGQHLLYDTGLQYDDGWMYNNPVSFDWRSTTHTSSVYNFSPYDTPLILTIEGKVTNPKITNQTTGKSMVIEREFNENEKIFIDGQHFLVYVADITAENYFLSLGYPAAFKSEIVSGNLFSYFSGDFIFLTSRQNDLVFEGVDPDCIVNYHWKHRFL